jgi:pyrimidine operon attenuation protein/uracil phosphoribosyltransferase
MPLSERTKIRVLSHQEVDRKIERIARQLHEENYQEKEIIFVGIAPRGAQLAQRLTDRLTKLKAFRTRNLEMRLDKDQPVEGALTLSADVEELTDSVVVLVDDVLQSGRTLMHAAAYLVQVPLKKLTTVVLVDRRHRSFPIRADMVGLTLSTTMQEHITVKFGKEDAVYLD